MGRRKVMLVGTDADAEQLVEYLQAAGGLDCHLLGIVASEREGIGKLVAQTQVVGAVEDLDQIVAEYGADELLFTSQTIAHILPWVNHGFATRHLRLRIIPASFQQHIAADSPQSLDDLPLVEVRT